MLPSYRAELIVDSARFILMEQLASGSAEDFESSTSHALRRIFIGSNESVPLAQLRAQFNLGPGPNNPSSARLSIAEFEPSGGHFSWTFFSGSLGFSCREISSFLESKYVCFCLTSEEEELNGFLFCLLGGLFQLDTR